MYNQDCLEDSAAGSSQFPHVRDSFLYLQNDIILDGALHLFVIGVKRDSRLAPFRATCGASEVVTPGPDLAGLKTEWVECGDAAGMNAGHVLLRWTRADVIYAVSLHGHTQVNRDVELAIAQRIEYIAPP